jgi:hypothetical protein
MLVRGQGERIPYTTDFVWHVKDVLAVLEIKKTLYARDLADAFDHLGAMRTLESNYIASGQAEREFDDSLAMRAFAQTTGLVAPPREELRQLELRDQLIFHILLLEQLTAIRIIFGYHGFRTQQGFRQGLYGHLKAHLGKAGFGPGRFPQLIVCGGYALCKANGQPFIAPLHEGMWPFYLSSSANPLALLL